MKSMKMQWKKELRRRLSHKLECVTKETILWSLNLPECIMGINI